MIQTGRMKPAIFLKSRKKTPKNIWCPPQKKPVAWTWLYNFFLLTLVIWLAYCFVSPLVSKPPGGIPVVPRLAPPYSARFGGSFSQLPQGSIQSGRALGVIPKRESWVLGRESVMSSDSHLAANSPKGGTTGKGGILIGIGIIFRGEVLVVGSVLYGFFGVSIWNGVKDHDFL